MKPRAYVNPFVRISEILKAFPNQQIRELLKFLLSHSCFIWEPIIEKGYCKEFWDVAFVWWSELWTVTRQNFLKGLIVSIWVKSDSKKWKDKLLYIAGRNINWPRHFGKQSGSSWKGTIWPILGIRPRKLYRALFVVAKKQKQSKCASTDK